MEVLHICSGYPDTKLYQNLLRELDNKGINQIMYVPYKSLSIENKRMLYGAENTRYVFSAPYNNFDKYIYHSKINKITKDIKEKIDLNKVGVTHAHFLFSNGGAAYKLKAQMGIEYIVAVRNTDVNYFFKYAVHLRGFGIKILKEAKKIIFLSPAYKDYVIEKYIPEKLKSEVENKSLIIPNGIDDFWLENINDNKLLQEQTVMKLVFIGELNKNKNIFTSIKAVQLLKDKGYSVKFDIIGKGPLEDEIEKMIRETNNQENIHLHGYVDSRKKLLKILRESNVFIMPSFNETFGLVYIEAMTQGLPVIYSRGQGIDGYFKNGEVGFSVSPESAEDIAINIEKIMENYNSIYKNVIQIVNEFKWSQIAEDYKMLYDY